MIWSGPAGTTPPACPSVTVSESLAGFLDTPPSKVTCSPTCACSPSSNNCVLPTTMTAGTATCPASGGAPFDAPASWDGACSAMDPVASADSLTVDPPALDGAGACLPSTPNVTAVEGSGTIAISCLSRGQNALGDVPGQCPGTDQQCTFPKVPEFTACTAIGEGTCPTGWPVQHTFFFPSCDCTCGPAVGDICSMTVTAYEDGACSMPAGSVTVTSDQPAACFDVSPSSALGSKSATVTYTPGMCASALTTIGSETLCCLK
jgi:hypothetical protein